MKAREEHITIDRSARLYLLGEAATARDVWVVCHGYGQLAGRFIGGFEAIATPDRLIVAPEGLHRFYLDPPPAPAVQRRVGATWMTREDRDTDIRDYVAYLDRALQYVMQSRPAVRVRALGFSQGCATVCRWAALGASRLDELILWSGEVPPDLDLEAAAARFQLIRISLVHGQQDRLAPRADQDLQRLSSAGLRFEQFDHAGGHHLDSNLLSFIADRI